MVEQSKKSRWWLAPAGFVVAVAVGFAGAQFRDVLVEDSTPLAATDTVTLTTQVVSTTIEPTTTLAPTTTVAETTTTLPNYEREELGLLKEGPEGRLVSTYQALLSGIVLAVENEQVTAQVEGTVTVREEWVLYVDLGNRPRSGETIVGRLILGNLPSGALPYCKPSAGGTSCNAVFEEEVGSLLKAGWRYEFFIRMVPETNCEDLPEEQNTAENQDLCLQWRNDLTSLWAYNGELVDALKGAELPDPDRIGSVGSVEIPLGSP